MLGIDGFYSQSIYLLNLKDLQSSIGTGGAKRFFGKIWQVRLLCEFCQSALQRREGEYGIIYLSLCFLFNFKYYKENRYEILTGTYK
jgi:hypothetical protein